jgi:hypothetical protein
VPTKPDPTCSFPSPLMRRHNHTVQRPVRMLISQAPSRVRSRRGPGVLAGDRKLAARARHLEIFCCGMPLSAPPAGAAISQEARERRSAFNALRTARPQPHRDMLIPPWAPQGRRECVDR